MPAPPRTPTPAAQEQRGAAHGPVAPAASADTVVHPRVIPQSWPTRPWRSFRFTEDGQRLIAEADTGAYLFDVATGAKLSDADEARQLGASATYPALTVSLEDGKLLARTMTERTGKTRKSLSSMAISPNGHFLVASDEGSVLLHDKTRALAKVLKISARNEFCYSLAVDDQGRWIACQGLDQLYIVDVSTARVHKLRHSESTLAKSASLAFHPHAATLASISRHGGLLIDLSQKLPHARALLLPSPGSMSVVGFTPRGDLLAVGDLRGNIHYFDGERGVLQRSSQPSGAAVQGIARVRNGGLALVVGQEQGSSVLRAWDGATGQDRQLARGVFRVSAAADGSALAAIGLAELRVLDAKSGGEIWAHQGVVEDAILLGDGGLLLAERELARGDLLAQGELVLSRVGLPDGRKAWSTVLPENTLDGFTASPGGEVAFMHTRDVYGRANLVQVDTATGRTSTLPLFSARLFDAARISDPAAVEPAPISSIAAVDASRVVLCRDGSAKVWNFREGGLTTIATVNGACAAAVSPDGSRLALADADALAIYETGHWKGVAHWDAHGAGFREMVFLTEHSLATLGRGGIQFWDLGSGHVGTLTIFPGSGSLLVGPDGRYMARGAATGRLIFELNGQHYPFERFDAALNQPHAALRSLGIADLGTIEQIETAFRRRPRMHGADVLPALDRSPERTLRFAEPPPLVTRAASVPLKLVLPEEAAETAWVRVRVNGNPLIGQEGRPVAASERAEVLIDVPLAPGFNRLEAEVAYVGGTTIGVQDIGVTRLGDGSSGRTVVYVIGVSEYPAPNALQFASKDALDVAALFKRLDRRTIIKPPLLEHAVTRERVLGLRQELAQLHPEDTVILFFSGHGVLDPETLSYTFATVDTDFAEPRRRGITADEIDTLLDGIPPHRKLVLLDTCHGGELDPDELAALRPQQRGAGGKGVSVQVLAAPVGPAGPARARAVLVRQFFSRLQRGSGAHILVSSAGAEYSYEDGSRKNGLFTHALVTGLGERRADTDGDGSILVTELGQYLGSEVGRLSLGGQVPGFLQLNRDTNFDLVRGWRQPYRGRGGGCARADEVMSDGISYDCDRFNIRVLWRGRISQQDMNSPAAALRAIYRHISWAYSFTSRIRRWSWERTTLQTPIGPVLVLQWSATWMDGGRRRGLAMVQGSPGSLHAIVCQPDTDADLSGCRRAFEILASTVGYPDALPYPRRPTWEEQRRRAKFLESLLRPARPWP